MLGGSAEKEEKHPIKVDDFEWMSFGQKASKNTENEKEQQLKEEEKSMKQAQEEGNEKKQDKESEMGRN